MHVFSITFLTASLCPTYYTSAYIFFCGPNQGTDRKGRQCIRSEMRADLRKLSTRSDSRDHEFRTLSRTRLYLREMCSLPTKTALQEDIFEKLWLATDLMLERHPQTRNSPSGSE